LFILQVHPNLSFSNFISILALFVSLYAVYLVRKSFKSATSPAEIRLHFEDSKLVSSDLVADSRIFILRFYIDSVFENAGGTSGSIANIFPRITKPELTLDPSDEHLNKTFWYIMPNSPAKTPIEGKVMEGHSEFPMKTEIRIFFDSPEEASRTLGSANEVEFTLYYKVSSEQSRRLQQQSESFKFILGWRYLMDQKFKNY